MRGTQKRPGKRARRLGTLEADILEELTMGDLLYGALLSAHSTRRMYKLARERAAYRHRRKRAVERLLESGLIRERGERISITDHGRNTIETLADTTRKLLERSPWDGKWRIVTFDIPEKHAALRRNIRSTLKRAGFVQLQQSLWIFPHECKEFTQLMKEEARLAPHVLYGVLDHIENDEHLRNMFRL